jgi:hypothetical protein
VTNEKRKSPVLAKNQWGHSTFAQITKWGHSTFELIESHGNICRHSMSDFATAIAKCVTENAEVVCPRAVPFGLE